MIIEKEFYKCVSGYKYKLLYDDDFHQFVLVEFTEFNGRDGICCYACPYQVSDSSLVVMLLEREDLSGKCLGQYLFYFENNEYIDYKIYQFPNESMLYTNWYLFLNKNNLFSFKE